jgi:hydroxymethylpyrimidine/phosphomethylpyrimidine kinase
MQIALTIAGSDSGGGAGIQADLKTFHQFGVFGTSVLVAITAQNTRGVSAVHPVPADVVRRQIDAVGDDLFPAAVKTGMLATAALVECVAEAIAERRFPNYVLDPVMVATSTIVTPNLDEAAILVGDRVDGAVRMEAAGRALLSLGPKAVLIKGGHGAGPSVVDVLVTADGVRHFEHRRLDTTSTHGTGCTLSSAITAGLALGRPLERAVRDGLDFVHLAIATAPGLGSGHGPLNHFVAPPKGAS